MSARVLGSLSMLLLAAMPANGAPAPREPTGKWVVNFDDAQCVATRSYGSAEQPLHLILKAPPLGGVMQIAWLRKGYTEPTQADALIAIDDQPAIKTNLLKFSAKNSKTRVYTLNLRSEDFARVRGAKRLSIRSQHLEEAFSVSQIETLLKVMDRCVADLRKVWNVTSAEGEASPLAQRAKGDLSKVARPDDYPSIAMTKRASGVVKFAVLIDEAGRVADCTVLETSGVAVLDGQTCALLRERAKFQPGVGTDGKPAKDAYIANFRWVLAD